MSLRSLNTTSIYKYAEDASGNKLTNIVMGYSLHKNGTIKLSYEDMEDVMYQITNRTSPFFSKYAVEHLVKIGRIEVVYNTNDQYRLTNAIPFFKRNIGNKTTIIVNVTNFASMNDDGSIRIAENTMYALLLSAAFCLEIDGKIQSFMKDVYSMYARLFTNVISNLAYLDNIKKEKIQYLATNFFFYQINSPERSFVNPMKDKLKYNSLENIQYMENSIPMYGDYSSYENLEVFIETLVKVFPEMKKVSFKNFIDRWSLSYGSSTLFACEYIPYFFYMIISAGCLSPIVNISKISTEIAVNLGSVNKKIEMSVNALD